MNALKILLSYLFPKGVNVNVELGTGYEKYRKMPGGFKPTDIVIHHSYSTDGTKRDWPGIVKFHTSFRHNGNIIEKDKYDELKAAGATGLVPAWKDVGYNFGIEDVDGQIVLQIGRLIGAEGAHAEGFNKKSIGICYVGSFDKIAPAERVLKFGLSLTRDLQIMFAIPRTKIHGHWETFALQTPPKTIQKSCPGRLFDMKKYRERCHA